MENINDIINKSKLLFNYNPKMTLTENVESKMISENVATELTENIATVRILGSMSDDVLRRLGDRIIKTSGQLTDDAGKAITNGDEFITAIKNTSLKQSGGLTKIALRDTAKSMMKMNPPVSGALRKSLTDKAANLALKDANYAAKNGDDVAKALKKKGYQSDIADEIGKKFDKAKGQRGGGGGGGRRGGGNQPPNPPNNPPVNPPVNPPIPLNPNNLNGIKSVLGKHWRYIEEMYRKGATRAYVRKWAIGMGLSVVAFMMFWNWLTGDDDRCPEGTYFDGTKCVPIPKPNDCPAGTHWNGTKCVPDGPVPPPKPPKVCTDFPYTMGCKSPIIAEVQDCLKLSADGIFGPKTLRGLQNGGYGNSITKEVYDKIKANCGKTDDNTTTTTTSDIVNVEDGDKISF